jgi:hypothetical protein
MNTRLILNFIETYFTGKRLKLIRGRGLEIFDLRQQSGGETIYGMWREIYSTRRTERVISTGLLEVSFSRDFYRCTVSAVVLCSSSIAPRECLQQRVLQFDLLIRRCILFERF